MLELRYSLVIEATADPTFFGFYSPDLEGFTGIGHSIEDCLYKAKWGMDEHIALLKEKRLPIPKPNLRPTIVVQNETRPRRRKTAAKHRSSQVGMHQQAN
ncbi:type II toxin-antitoxin system HicB family antitoxin [candidate division KSB1 bacterium]|nr:type II toxin-antitoxin system HicB family antitoxin [candidate division KSB1 bacterium]